MTLLFPGSKHCIVKNGLNYAREVSDPDRTRYFYFPKANDTRWECENKWSSWDAQMFIKMLRIYNAAGSALRAEHSPSVAYTLWLVLWVFPLYWWRSEFKGVNNLLQVLQLGLVGRVGLHSDLTQTFACFYFHSVLLGHSYHLTALGQHKETWPVCHSLLCLFDLCQT